MGYFRERRRARQEARLAQQQAEAAAGNGMHPSAEEALVSEEARLAEEARRMILGDVGNGNGVGNGGGGMPPSSQSPAHAQSPQQLHTAQQSQSQAQPYEPTPQELTSILSPSAEQKILALHQQFDTDEDGCLSHQELQALQNATSGADMSLHEYTMICHALRCEPRRGITLDALRLTYATVEDCDANIDADYDRVFGSDGISSNDDDGTTTTPDFSSSAAGAQAQSDVHATCITEDDSSQPQPPPRMAELPHYETSTSCLDDSTSASTTTSTAAICTAADGKAIPQEEEAKARLEMGDHVFKRRAAGLAQVHAIVVSMAPGKDGPLLLADFTGQNAVEDGNGTGDNGVEEEEEGNDDDDDDHDGNEDVEGQEENNGMDDNEEKEGGENSIGKNGDDDGINDATEAAAAAEVAKAAAREQPPDPTVERVRIICVEGRKNIRKWKKVRYGRKSAIKRWLSSKSRRSRVPLSDEAVVSTKSPPDDDEDASTTIGESISPSTAGEEEAEGFQQQPPKTPPPPSDEEKKKKDAEAAAKAAAEEEIPETDPGTLVVERVNFLLENQHLIPPWNALKSNSECIAVWCKTGRWSTYQVSGYLRTLFMGQAKTAATVAAAASTASVTVPAAGYMGWLGFTTQVSLLALHPWLIPAIAGYGIASIGVPMYILRKCGTFWAKTTIELNDEFWSRAPPDVYVDCIKRWSGLDYEE